MTSQAQGVGEYQREGDGSGEEQPDIDQGVPRLDQLKQSVEEEVSTISSQDVVTMKSHPQVSNILVEVWEAKKEEQTWVRFIGESSGPEEMVQ